jgi:hypothetical protein
MQSTLDGPGPEGKALFHILTREPRAPAGWPVSS